MLKRAFSIMIEPVSKWSKHKRSKKALIVYGGSEEHRPEEIAAILAGLLKEEHFDVWLSPTLDSFTDAGKLKQVDLIVLIWTTGTITPEQLAPLLAAVQDGAGFAGIHSTVGAFRGEIEFHHMIGGQFLAHPGGQDVTYKVQIADQDNPITNGIQDFTVTTEKYYMMLDPAIKVLAFTCFSEVSMPVVWTKNYGKGRVFYCSLGHTLDIVTKPQVLTLMGRGMAWAAR